MGGPTDGEVSHDKGGIERAGTPGEEGFVIEEARPHLTDGGGLGIPVFAEQADAVEALGALGG